MGNIQAVRTSTALDRWLRRYGWRGVLIAMATFALLRGWEMWRHPVLPW